MVLDAAASTSEGMLSLSVDVDERGASASSSWSRSLVLAGGATAVQQDHVRSLAARQPWAAKRFQARRMSVECTASAEPESYRTPRSCLRAVTQRLEAWRGLREQRRVGDFTVKP